MAATRLEQYTRSGSPSVPSLPAIGSSSCRRPREAGVDASVPVELFAWRMGRSKSPFKVVSRDTVPFPVAIAVVVPLVSFRLPAISMAAMYKTESAGE